MIETIDGSSLFPPRVALLKTSGEENQTVSAHGIEPYCITERAQKPTVRDPVGPSGWRK